MHDPVPCPGVVCVPGRCDAAFLASGAYPVFYHANRTDFEPEELAHVYVDVSGSMADEISNVFGVMAASRELIADPVHEFSNVIEDVALAEFCRGLCRSTGGTDFTAVMKHALDRDFRQIVMFTDGVGLFDDAVAERFVARKIKLHLVLVSQTVIPRFKSDLLPLATSVFVMS